MVPANRDGAGDVTVEVGATQPLPEGDELDFLDEGAADADFMLPPNRKAARRIAGQHLDGETLFAFRGCPTCSRSSACRRSGRGCSS